MTTPLDKTLKRELSIEGLLYVLAISPEGLKLTLKGHRKGLELSWQALVSGEAALATALHASIGQFVPGKGKPESAALPAPAAAPPATSSAKRAKRTRKGR